MKKNTLEIFIEKARQVHGDKYDYSKVEYKTNNTKVCIICPEHGEFWQRPNAHISAKQGCPICSKNISKFNTKSFIEKARQIHGDKYDYSKVNYINNHTKVCIICPEHGEFWQRPSHHVVRGDRCPKCSVNYKKDTKSFIEKAKRVHGDKYDYSKVNYINNHTKVCIICPEHGEFWQIADYHIQGNGCPVCGGKEKITTEIFLERLKKLDLNKKYDLSKIKYVNTKTKVETICPKHGSFWILPSHLYRGCGCPKCRESKGERAIRMFLEENKIPFEEQKRFDSCKNLKPLPFDFYLPDYNLCIEFQGKQHYEPWHTGKNIFESLKGVQKRDAIKKEWCSKKENPNLLEIKYTDDVYEILTEQLSLDKNLKKSYNELWKK